MLVFTSVMGKNNLCLITCAQIIFTFFDSILFNFSKWPFCIRDEKSSQNQQ